MVIDPARMGITWARFSHLFMNFYVFQYGIGIAAAAALSEAILAEGEPARERYLTFLRAAAPSTRSSPCATPASTCPPPNRSSAHLRS